MLNLWFQEMLIDWKHWTASLSPAEIKAITKASAMLVVLLFKVIASAAGLGRKKRR
jgi:fucose permease